MFSQYAILITMFAAKPKTIELSTLVKQSILICVCKPGPSAFRPIVVDVYLGSRSFEGSELGLSTNTIDDTDRRMPEGFAGVTSKTLLFLKKSAKRDSYTLAGNASTALNVSNDQMPVYRVREDGASFWQIGSILIRGAAMKIDYRSDPTGVDTDYILGQLRKQLGEK